MSQSLVKQYAHIVFSTKYRHPFLIDKKIRRELYAYMDGILLKIDCIPVIIGGVADHVHILTSISKSYSLSKIVGELKRDSSLWIKTKEGIPDNFYWQNGYGAFSVGKKDLDIVRRYIENQEWHHNEKTYQNEYITILDENDVEYDKKYVWD